MSLIEEEILRRATGGDQEALVELLERHAPAVRSCLAGKIDPRWRSLLSEDDVMQETYTDVFLGMSRFIPQGEDAFLRWICTLARNNLLDAIKGLNSLKQGGQHQKFGARNSQDSDLDLIQQLGGTVTSPSLAAARNEAKQLLNKAINQLSSPDQIVVRLYDLEGRSVTEVANALGCSSGAVFMRRARAHLRLKEILGSSSHF
jgi:RNA polymerase sigma-70 factor, ECF subfamily